MRTAVALLAAAAAAACAASQPAPVDYRGQGGGQGPTAAAPPPSTPPAPRAQRPAPVALEPTREEPPPAFAPPATDPPPDWAEGEGTPLSAYALRPEEAHPFPLQDAPAVHIVQPGETLYMVAAARQAPLRALIDANRLAPPFALTPGARLTIPPPRTHMVARGESLIAISRRYNVDARSLALMNRLAPPYRLEPGVRLFLPALARPTPEAAPVAAPAPPQAAAAPRPSGPSRFAWPVTGAVLTRFGPLPGGGRSDGIEIASRAGSDVRAAAAGRVAYVGDELEGYGTLILVSHAEGWVTAYAYTRAPRVQAGQSVAAGATLAEAAGDRVLFQARRGSAPADPVPLLPPT